MSQTSPIVPTEPQIVGIPVFPSAHSALDFAMNQLTSRSFRRLPEKNSCKSLPELSQSSGSNCQCPHILVADDDHFQNFFYETLFLQSISWEEISESKEGLKYEIFTSGEELIQKFQRMQACGCKKITLIITDYNMGNKKLNGVDTIQVLRKKGYTGPVVLRTSEDQEYLTNEHPDFLEMLENEVITNYVKKQSFKEAKEVIVNLIKKF